jgi:hypothetical protein
VGPRKGMSIGSTKINGRAPGGFEVGSLRLGSGSPGVGLNSTAWVVESRDPEQEECPVSLILCYSRVRRNQGDQVCSRLPPASPPVPLPSVGRLGGRRAGEPRCSVLACR